MVVDGYRPLDFQVFVMRIARQTTDSTWRGQIVHLPDQATAGFASWEQALAFIQRYFVNAGFDQDHADDLAPTA